MLSPEGFVMCRCDEKKAQWYLARGLAKFIVDDPLVFQLRFEPKSLGNYGNTKYSNFYLASKKNRCCVCGKKKDLTRHHCVPHFYRKHLPESIKSHNSHDVFLLCADCHSEYERVADAFRKQLVVESGIPLHSTKKSVNFEESKIFGLCAALVTHGEKIPANRRSDMMKKIREYFGKDVSDQEIKEFAVPRKKVIVDTSNHGKMVVEKHDPDDFVKRWRRHFVESMKPKFMPAYWDIDNPIQNCSDSKVK